MTNTNNQNLDGGRVSIWPTVWKYSLIIAAATFVYELVLYLTGLIGTTGFGLIRTIIAVVLLVVALRQFRSLNNGYMTFGQALGLSFMASIVSTAIRAALTSAYLATFGEEILASLLEQTVGPLQANPAMDSQTMEMVTGVLGAVFTPAGIFVSSLISGAIGGFIISLILAMILKKPPPITD
jgi:hypothetical protein